jgi:hypothetical protein
MRARPDSDICRSDQSIALPGTVGWHYGRFVTLAQCMLLGAAGGGLVELLEALGDVLLWKQARRTPGGRVKKTPPKARAYLDLPGHAGVLAIRLPLGAIAAWAFSGQINGPYAALALGFAAPSVLAQLGRFPLVAEAVQRGSQDGLPPGPAASPSRKPDAQLPQEVEQT